MSNKRPRVTIFEQIFKMRHQSPISVPADGVLSRFWMVLEYMVPVDRLCKRRSQGPTLDVSPKHPRRRLNSICHSHVKLWPDTRPRTDPVIQLHTVWTGAHRSVRCGNMARRYRTSRALPDPRKCGPPDNNQPQKGQGNKLFTYGG
jgi:hypothetical protein